MSKNIISEELIGRKVKILHMDRYEMIGTITKVEDITSGDPDELGGLFYFEDKQVTVECFDAGRHQKFTFMKIDEEGRMFAYLLHGKLI